MAIRTGIVPRRDRIKYILKVGNKEWGGEGASVFIRQEIY